MVSHSSSLLLIPVYVLLLLGVGWEPAHGQFGPGRSWGGRSGFGFQWDRQGDLFGQLRRSVVQEELGLTEEQKAGIERLSEQARPNREETFSLFTKLREAESDEERTAIREELQQMAEKRRQQARDELQKILSPEQYRRLQQLTLHAAGPSALADDEVAGELNLTDQQNEQVETILQERREAARRSRRSFNSDEDREKFQQEWDEKLLAVLTAEQRGAWQEKLGAPPAESTVSDSAPSAARHTAETSSNRQIRSQSVSSSAEPAEAVNDRPSDPSSQAASFAPLGNSNRTEPAASAAETATADTPAPTDMEMKDGDEGRLISFNFRYAPWSEVLKLFAETNGLTLHLKDVPPGTFNYYDQGRYSPQEALDILNGYLMQEGYILIRRDRFLVSLNYDNPIPPNLIETVSVDELAQRGKNEYLTVAFPLEGVAADEVATEIESLIGPQGKVVPLKKANRLVVTGIGRNLMRIRDQLQYYLVPEEEQVFRSFTLQHVAAADCEQIVRSLFGLPGSGVQTVSAGALGERDSRSRGRSRSDWRSDSRFSYSRMMMSRRREERESSPPSSTASGSGRILVATDERTNSLLVQGSPADLKMVEEVVRVVDVENSAAGSFAYRRRDEPYLENYQLKTADAVEVAKTLNALYPGAVVNEDGRARRIHIYASPDKHREISAIISKLDGQGGGGLGVAVIPLSRLDPFAASSTLKTLFARDGEAAPVIEADMLGHRLLVRGNSSQIQQVKTLLAEMGEDGSGSRLGSLQDGPVRSIPLGGHDPQALLQMIQNLWEASDSTPIRVIVPSDSGPVRDLRIPSADSTVAPPQDKTTGNAMPSHNLETRLNRESDVLSRLRVRQASQVQVRNARDGGEHGAAEDSRDSEYELSERQALEDFEEALRSLIEMDADGDDLSDMPSGPSETMPVDTSASSLPENGPPTGAESSPTPGNSSDQGSVALSVSGGNLVMASGDEEALDRLESLVQRIIQAMPLRTQWTVFYLRSADATETALMLEQLFPSSTVSDTADGLGDGLLGGLMGGFSSLGNMTGLTSLQAGPQTLRIIPEVRSNALFVSGPPAKVREIESVLKVLDASELPDQLRDRAPRMIPVEYADVNQVAQIVRDVFKEEISPSNADGGRGRGNPLQLLMGGGGGRNSGRERQAAAVRLTVGVDTRTSQLVVSCNDTLFRQVESLVQSLDEAALEARRTVRVVTLESANSQVVQQALGSLLPQVKISATSTAEAAKSSDSSKGDSSSETRGRRSNRREDSNSDSNSIRQFFEQRMRERMERSRGNSESGGDRSNRFRGRFGGSRRGRGR